MNKEKITNNFTKQSRTFIPNTLGKRSMSKEALIFDLLMLCTSPFKLNNLCHLILYIICPATYFFNKPSNRFYIIYFNETSPESSPKMSFLL